MFPWSIVHVINAYVDNLCIHEDDTNSPKENLPPQLPAPCPKVYHIVVLIIIRNATTSHFIIVFVDVVHA